MPEGPEVETERLHEAIHEELEHEGGTFLKRIALTTAILAALAAVAALKAGATVNEALVLKTEATRLQAEASDQWAYYQAQGIKGELQAASRTPWLALDKPAPPVYEQEERRHQAKQAEAKKKAEELEHELNARSREADNLLHSHHGFADTVALFQVSIALGAVAALTRNRLVWFGSMLVGLCGIALFAFTLLH